MKVGQFSDTFLPVVDGVGRVVSHYAYLMGELCEACYVIAPRQVNLVREGFSFEIVDYRSFPVPRNPQYRAGIPALDLSYRKRLVEIELDIVHAHSPFVAGREALRIARRRGIPLVATFHSKYYDDFYQTTGSKTLAELGTKYVVNFFAKCDQVWLSAAPQQVLRIMIGRLRLWRMTPKSRSAAAKEAEERFALHSHASWQMN